MNRRREPPVLPGLTCRNPSLRPGGTAAWYTALSNYDHLRSAGKREVDIGILMMCHPSCWSACPMSRTTDRRPSISDGLQPRSWFSGPLVWHQSQSANLPELLAQFLPGLTPIAAYVHIAVEAGRGDRVRSRRMGGEPIHDRVRLHRQLERFPRLAAIGGTLDRARNAWDGVPVTDEDDVRVIGL